MWRKWKEIKERTEAWLDERWEIANYLRESPSKTSFYYGAVKALESVGIEWRRNHEGKHSIYRNDQWEEVLCMKRDAFKEIIKLRSALAIDKRRGDYALTNGKRLSDYVRSLAESQMELDNLLIRENGDLCVGSGGTWNRETSRFDDYMLMPDFQGDETCSVEEMEKRIAALVAELVQ